MGCVLMSKWHDFQLYQLSMAEKLHKGCVITSAYLNVFVPSGRQSGTKSCCRQCLWVLS